MSAIKSSFTDTVFAHELQFGPGVPLVSCQIGMGPETQGHDDELVGMGLYW